jgi:YD repeat-containing protein
MASRTSQHFLYSLFLLCLLFTCVSLSAQSGVQYVYDQLGRLVGVIDPSGNAAGYSYDAVGNLLAITRFTASQASVLQFTPSSGPIGTTVTIYGTGFSSTISSDAVSFNGTSATITSASVNQIVTTVPTGTTTGTLSITTPAGSFTTATQFTVTASTGTPTITSFSPSSGTAGTSLTIDGTNFETVAANNQIKVNVTHTFASSATSTAISTVVPSAGGSGHIAVGTTRGQVTSTQDFYIPFGGHAASAIAQTGRITFGGSQSVSLSSGQIALLLFDASPGQRASLQLSSSTLSVCTIYIFGPTGIQLASSSCTSSVTSVSSTFLPISGTYTIGVDAGTSSGSLTVGLNGDITDPITPNGTTVTLSLAAGQDGHLTFAGYSGQTATVQATGDTLGSTTVALLAPGGTTVISTTNGASSFFLGPQQLATTGAYTVTVGPAPASGSITIGLTLVPAPTPPPSRSSSSVVDYSNALSTHLVGLYLMNEGSGTTDQNLTDLQAATFSGSIVPAWNTSDPSIIFGGGSSQSSYLNAGMT